MRQAGWWKQEKKSIPEVPGTPWNVVKEGRGLGAEKVGKIGDLEDKTGETV